MSASPLRRARRVLALSIAAALAAAALVFAVAPAATAASQGAGFGAWQPTSTHGWHGSMRVGDVHTYCILPGIPLPTGTTSDHGVRTEAAGLSPQQLTGINLLVTRYGQTEDPVQAVNLWDDPTRRSLRDELLTDLESSLPARPTVARRVESPV